MGRLSVKKTCFFLSLVLFVFYLIIFFTFNVHYLCSFSFFPFSDMSTLLYPSHNQSLQTEMCDHLYEKHRTQNELEWRSSKDVTIGGYWTPSHCRSKYRINIIVPFRQREEQLKAFSSYIHPFLQLQEIEYRLVVVEQDSEKDFNRGKLFNIGFTEAQKRFPADCYIFHDVDLIPLSINNIYACTTMPRHLSSAVDEFNYKLPYCNIFGGVVALRSHHFQQINGYSNMFYGWGGEDDDLYNRVYRTGLKVIRFEEGVSRYRMLKHTKQIPNPDRFTLMENSSKSILFDGLTGNNLNYTLISFVLKPLYTWLLVHI